MIFNSLAFVVFFPVVLAVYAALQRNLRAQNTWLLVASYVFYGWWDWRFLGLIAFSTVVDYVAALQIEQSAGARRKQFLILSLIVNLGTLAIFKYLGFFAESARELLALLGFAADVPTLQILLPVGVSFYTFQSMSYTIDVYRREMPARRRFDDFALYVSFFPQLVAGPIERAATLLPQIEQPRRVNAAQVSDGLWLILVGYLKKVVIADQLGQIANLGFVTDTPGFGAAEAAVFVLAFAFQIYGDFSGYTDIARGVAKIMGFEFMLNFRAPYLVRNPSAFWRHWHISLSSWLRDYLYVPLGGNRGTPAATYRNLMLTMFLGGLWHGAGWAFVIWGVYHGVLLAVHRFWTRHVSDRLPWAQAVAHRTPSAAASPRWPVRLFEVAQVGLFFVLTCLGWLFFRVGTASPEVDQARLVINYVARFGAGLDLAASAPWLPSLLLLGGLALFLQARWEAMERFHTWRPARQVLGVVAVLALIALFGVFEGAAFIYFQF